MSGSFKHLLGGSFKHLIQFSAQPPKVKEPQRNTSHKVGEGLSFPKTSVLDSFITPAMWLGTSSIISSTPIPSFFSLLL